ncbi:universal stress protein [Sphingomonas oryzagri]
MKILAVITRADTVHACLDAAATASVGLPGVKIEALHTIVDPMKLVAASEEIQLQRLRERDEGTAEQKAQACQTAFVQWNLSADDHTPKIEWQAPVEAEEQSIRERAADADLIVLARGHDMDTGDAFHAALFEAKKPLLLVPAHWRAPAGRGFEHIAIGVEDDATERAAIAAARPWLRVASRITAIRIEETHEPDKLGREALGEDIDVEWHVAARRHDIELGAQIAEEAEAVGAELLVCGAYRHNSLIEWLFGGTTRHLLSASNLPVLMAH